MRRLSIQLDSIRVYFASAAISVRGNRLATLPATPVARNPLREIFIGREIFMALSIPHEWERCNKKSVRPTRSESDALVEFK